MNFLRNRKKINYKRISVSIIVVIGILTINIGYSYLESITSLFGSFTTTDNLNNCYQVEILGKKVNACVDNKKSKYVSSATGIDFSNASSNTNGKGLYVYSSTKDDTNPIYYYRGDVNDNNVIFANRCWKIVRTTDTGGTKLIYNGVPTDGKCNNTGSSSLLGKSQFNSDNDSPSGVGYMYGEVQSVKTGYEFNTSKSTVDKNFSPLSEKDTSNSSNYYYSKTYTYDFESKMFSLDSSPTRYGNWATAWKKLGTGYYTCQSVSSTSCSQLIYVYGGTETKMQYVDVYEPKKIDGTEDSYDYFDSSKLDSATKKEKSFTSYNYYYSTSYTWDGSKYILGSDAKKMGDYADIANDVFGYYSCLSTTSTSCFTLAYVTYPHDSITLLYIPLTNGRTIEQENIDMYFSESIQKNADGTYTLVNPKAVKRDQWGKEYEKLEFYYKCGTADATTCSDMEFVNSTLWYFYWYIPYSQLKVGSTATWDGNQYTLSGDVVTYDNMEFFRNDSTIKNYHYACENWQSDCTSLRYYLGGSTSFVYYTKLTNGVILPYENMFPDNSNRSVNDSKIKKYIDTNLFETGTDNLNNYISYLEDTIWCNERYSKDINGWNPNGGIRSSIYFKKYSDSSIEFTCSNTLDNFTVSSDNGNGSLKYPVGLLTSSEVRLAGNASSSYLNIGYDYWLMTPNYFYSTNGFVNKINRNGNEEREFFHFTSGVRPSISLKSGVTISSGSGTANNPYIVE